MDLDRSAPVYAAPTVARLLGRGLHSLADLRPPPAVVEGFITFWDPGLSIVSLWDLVGNFSTSEWYLDERFALVEDAPQYRQVRPTVPGSCGKTYDEQLALLSPDEEVPMARIVVTALIVHFLATGERLLPDVYARCHDTASGGTRVCVGHFDLNGFRVRDYWDDNSYAYRGLASSLPPRKL